MEAARIFPHSDVSKMVDMFTVFCSYEYQHVLTLVDVARESSQIFTTNPGLQTSVEDVASTKRFKIENKSFVNSAHSLFCIWVGPSTICKCYKLFVLNWSRPQFFVVRKRIWRLVSDYLFLFYTQFGAFTRFLNLRIYILIGNLFQTHCNFFSEFYICIDLLC